MYLKRWKWAKSYQALSMDHSLDSDSDGGTITLFDVIGNNDADLKKQISVC